MGETTHGATAAMIDGMGYMTAGLTLIADYQKRSDAYIQPQGLSSRAKKTRRMAGVVIN